MGTGIDNTLLLRTKFVDPHTGILTRQGVLYLQSIPGTRDIADLTLLGNLDDSFTAASLARSQPKILYDTHANRVANYPAAAFPPASLFYETDRTVWYQVQIVSSVNAWVYVGGTSRATQSQLVALAASLAADSASYHQAFPVYVTDYAHQLQWIGAAWAWGPNEDGSGDMRLFEIDPTGTGWHLYDGSTVDYLKSDGTLGSVTLPNLASSAAFTVAGSPNSGPNAAVNTTLTTGSGSVAAGLGAPATFLTSVSVNTQGTPANIVRRPWFRQ